MRRFAPRLSQVRWLDVYVGGIVALGGAVAALAIVTGVPTVPAWQVVLLAVCCGATQLVPTSLPRSSSVSPAVVISFAALVCSSAAPVCGRAICIIRPSALTPMRLGVWLPKKAPARFDIL